MNCQEVCLHWTEFQEASKMYKNNIHHERTLPQLVFQNFHSNCCVTSRYDPLLNFNCPYGVVNTPVHLVKLHTPRRTSFSSQLLSRSPSRTSCFCFICREISSEFCAEFCWFEFWWVSDISECVTADVFDVIKVCVWRLIEDAFDVSVWCLSNVASYSAQ